MADVRALLREERASRRINHPQATYSTGGILICLTCHIQIKAESLWEKHLRSPHHTMQLQRKRDETLDRPPGATASIEETTSGKNPNQNSKKRKADVDEEPTTTTKKAKAVNEVPGSFPEKGVIHTDRREPEPRSQKQSSLAAEPDTNLEEPTLSQSNQPSLISPSPPHTSSHTTALPTRSSPRNSIPAATVDEDEWAAFEREIAAATHPPPTASTAASALLASAGTITAAPLSAAELAAQAREEAEQAQTKTEEAEAEAEKEDAERRLEDEFEEMAGLEERVRMLKEKREALRRKGEGGGAGGASGKTDRVNSVAGAGGQEGEGKDREERKRPVIETLDEGKKAVDDDGGGGDSSSDDYEDDGWDWDTWRR